MTLDFKDIQISVSGQPIMAESINLNWISNSSPVHSLGYQNCIGYIRNESPQTNLSISYIMEIGNDPFFSGINNLISNRPTGDINPFPIVVGNISGEYYPTTFSFEIPSTPDIILGQIELVSFKGISGFLNSGNKLDYNKSNGNNVAHSSVCYATSNNKKMTEYDILNFSFSVSFSISPNYIMGKSYPFSVLCDGGTIEAELNTLSLNSPNFSGQSLREYFNFRTFDISLVPIKAIFTDDYFTHDITQLYDGYINNIQIQIQNDGYVNSNVSIKKDF